MNVIHERAIIIGRAAFIEHCFVTIPKETSPKLVPSIVAPGIAVLEPLHSGHQIGFRRFQHEMVMVAHQDPGVHIPACSLTRFAQGPAEKAPVLVIPKDACASISSGHYGVGRSWIFDSNPSSHACLSDLQLQMSRFVD